MGWGFNNGRLIVFGISSDQRLVSGFKLVVNSYNQQLLCKIESPIKYRTVARTVVVRHFFFFKQRC